jgi:hypothetical protein
LGLLTQRIGAAGGLQNELMNQTWKLLRASAHCQPARIRGLSLNALSKKYEATLLIVCSAD